MAQTILVNTEQVRMTGGEFLKKKAELEELLARARSQMDALQSEFKGMRATKIHQEWTDMIPGLQQAITNLEQAGNLLNRAATDFTQVDSAL
jgi:WXG100 family type VII secretion target